MIKTNLRILDSNGHVEKGVLCMKRGYHRVYKSVYRLFGEKEWRYLDTSKVVKGL